MAAMDNLFKLTGTIKDGANRIVPEFFLAIVDEDTLAKDDLLGVGLTDRQGKFSISFLDSEFRQDLFEREETPDIKIIGSVMFDDVRKAIFYREFPQLDWSNNQEVDLGDIVMDGVDMHQPIALKGIEPIPGYKKRAKRLNIDHELVSYCLAEVAPIITYLTGWENLLDDIKVEVVNSLSPYLLRESFVAEGKDPNSSEAKLAAFFADIVQGPQASCALYDPHTHSIVVNKKKIEQVGIEGLKVICGHELVHVGQYKYTKGLKTYNLNHLLSMAVSPEKHDPEVHRAKVAYIAELEGYAQYIEEDFLRKHYYRMALTTYHSSLLEDVFQAFLSMTGDSKKKSSQQRKTEEYEAVVKRYRTQQVGEQPSRFQLDVSKLFGGW